MGYALIDGKRYYVDDRTKEMTLDNVSQAEADQRALSRKRPRRRRRRRVPCGSMAERGRGMSEEQEIREARGSEDAAGGQIRIRNFPKEWAVLIVTFLFIIGAAVYNQTHISGEEAEIAAYMEEEPRRETGREPGIQEEMD